MKFEGYFSILSLPTQAFDCDGEMALGRAVLDNALKDIITGHAEADSAKDWIKTSGKDFHTICDIAYLDPEFVKQTSIRILERFGKEL